ncbi:PEP-CTERM sorting domain-containing protein [Opitutaceae bacterium TAV4]|nr:PEP-CTERM sorting domain-containing protein [Opitutaceae bacterium TAV4]RRK00310.1 PEP-CTERM sorting domain-containing protein [Opitutaceae bacterium TAV3]
MKAHNLSCVKLASALLAGFLAFASSAQATPISLDLLSSSAPWYSSTSQITFSKTTEKITYSPKNENTDALSYFASQDSPVTLDIGEKLTLSFDYTITGAVNNRNNSLRIGLFSSGDETRVSADFSDAGANNYTGYFITTNPGLTSSSGTTLRARSESSSSVSYLMGGSNNSLHGDVLNTSAATKVTADTSYSGFLEIERISEDAVRITYSFGGKSVVYTDSAYNYTSFDTIGVNFSKLSTADPTTLMITRLTLQVTAAIPEATTVALLGGLGSLLAVVLIRHFNR